MGWIHETCQRVVRHDPLATAAANLAAARIESAYVAFEAFEDGKNPSLNDFLYSHTLGLAVYDGVSPYLVYRKGGAIVALVSNADLSQLLEQIKAANAAEAEAIGLAEACAAGMTFSLQEASRAVKRRFPELAERIGNADITSNGEDLRYAERIYGFCAVGEEVIFALTGTTRKTKHSPTGEEIVLNTLTGEMYHYQPESQPDYDANGAVASYGSVMTNNPFAALLNA